MSTANDTPSQFQSTTRKLKTTSTNLQLDDCTVILVLGIDMCAILSGPDAFSVPLMMRLQTIKKKTNSENLPKLKYKEGSCMPLKAGP